MSTSAEEIAAKQTGTVTAGPDPYPPADPANKAPIDGSGWVQMIRRFLKSRGLDPRL
jgi:hypothetical protein